MAALPRRDDVIYVGLVLNGARSRPGDGHEDRWIGVVAVATDAFGLRNQKQTWRESVDVSIDVIGRAKQAGLRAQATIAVAFGCPFEGEVPLARVVEMARAIAQAGPHEIAVADTVGVGVPRAGEEMIAALREAIPQMPLRMPFPQHAQHRACQCLCRRRDGRGAARFQRGGIGGCPFGARPTGNIGTEDLVYLLERSGFETGYDLGQLNAMAPWLAERLALTQLPAMVSRTAPFPG